MSLSQLAPVSCDACDDLLPSKELDINGVTIIIDSVPPEGRIV